MRSIRDIISLINETLGHKFRDIRGYGVATTIRRGEELLPVSNEQYIGLDDSFAIQVYHKILGITMTESTQGGYGRNSNTQINTYSMAMIVASDEKKTKLMPDQVALVIQSAIYNIPFSTDFFRSVEVSIRNVVLNSEQTYQQEYRSDSYRLSEYQSLTQINYSVEITWKPGCFVACPEDLIHCKN